MAATEPTRTVVNETPVVLDLESETPLVYALRNDLGLYGVRQGCSVGECGSCVVLVEGRAERSCQLPVSAVAGRRVTTPEGLGTPDRPHPVQQAFLDEQAAQCGYCINGIIMTTAGLLGVDGAEAHAAGNGAAGNGAVGTGRPVVDEEQIQAALAEHVCRCGTHHRILRAIRRLAGQEQPAPLPPVQPDGAAAGGPAANGSAATGATGANGSAGLPTPGAAVRTGDLPGPLRDARQVEDWIRPLPDGRIEVRTGRVEFGQGIRTALAQLVAGELEVPLDQIVVRSAATDLTPDEGYTAGSNSLEVGGAVVGRAAAAFRRLRAAGLPPTGPVLPEDLPRWGGGPVGEAAPRDDLRAKLTGSAAYAHDLAFPGMLYARALLPPSYDARLVELDEEATRAMPGVEAVVRDGRLVLVVAVREEIAVRAVRRLARDARWQEPATEWEPSAEPPVLAPVVEDVGVPEALLAGRRVRASYAKPYEAHASIAPSSATAVVQPDGITVWCHNQGVYPLRRELAALLGEDESRLTVRHVDGPGGYGHNGADDAAGFAVMAARAVPGRPVRFNYFVQDEFGWEPYATAMSADLEASLDDDGRVLGWRHRIYTGAHGMRPTGSGDRLVVSWLRAGGAERPWAGGGEGGVRSAEPIYQFGAREVVGEYTRGALRTSSLRSLGGYFNTFAMESFMDELAEEAGVDPVEFRLAHLRDERARAVLETAAEHAAWQPRVGPSGRGRGVAVGRYKGSKAYVAHVIDVEVDTDTGAVAVRRVVTVCDAGVVINPDGLRNQIEGGILQGLSRALHEEVRHGPGGIQSRDWTTYPVLRFAEVPQLDVVLLDRPGLPPLGAGEASTPPTPAALANAVDDAVGIRIRSLPLTPERLRARLEDMTEGELSRVLV
ncbi:molybdopterin cofactor-binding domain-containing protein [Actinopolymorpha pittospori]|uniref:CO/xanthine dehydrogenase Mo-binding subunit/aerobic-type carbon monoxide dehydrogenase small subunit (CoxS/CutS family) n=1 Tax=Actinopolymorpha pittospori TaxID=648752 RepID=A0A927MWX8_9ACTN|nr:CO/xanthine dehydrogenase Mo-binding subunit/aerobic-type carbon monoxide dehydrogenase small subunit (CoxS/CutS family) [Actinopolymorpha pittospori]